jgi:hypothetical protein
MDLMHPSKQAGVRFGDRDTRSCVLVLLGRGRTFHHSNLGPNTEGLRNLSAALVVKCAVRREQPSVGGLILIPGLTSSSIFLSKGKGFPKTA